MSQLRVDKVTNEPAAGQSVINDDEAPQEVIDAYNAHLAEKEEV